VGKADIWMPVYIGDYLADTMHLSTEQHGAYLLLLFHLWRRGTLQDDDVVLAKITGLAQKAWSSTRLVLAEFFQIHDGLWHHSRVERERIRVAAKQQSKSRQAKLAASSRWNKCASHAVSIAGAMPDDAKSEPQSESEPEPELCNASLFEGIVSEKRGADRRHMPFRSILAEYWSAKNHASPEMPWQGRDAKALSEFLAASPSLTEQQFRQMLGNRARSAIAHGDRVYLWIGNLTRFQEEITVFNKPVSAGGGYASRAEINRNSVVSAVVRAVELSREPAHRAGQAGPEPAAFDDAGMSFADGAGPDRCALAAPGVGDHGMAAGDIADGQTGTDGQVPYRTATEAAGKTDRVGRQEVNTW
jgi:uncharacterized protein YdaU (DUF1376 family)